MRMAESSMDAPSEIGKRGLEWMLDFGDITYRITQKYIVTKTFLRMALGPKLSQNGPEIQTRSEHGPGRARVYNI